MRQLFVKLKKAHDSVRRETLYNILIEYDSLMKLVRLQKMCLNETYSRVRVGKHLSDMFPIKNGLKRRCFIALLFNFSLDYVTRRVQVNQDGLKLNGAHQLVVYADDANILGGSVHTAQENTEALQVTSKKTGLTVNADKTKYMVMSGDQNARRRHSTQTENSFFERVENFKYFKKKKQRIKILFRKS